jgi:hypothetical protein
LDTVAPQPLFTVAVGPNRTFKWRLEANFDFFLDRTYIFEKS